MLLIVLNICKRLSKSLSPSSCLSAALIASDIESAAGKAQHEELGSEVNQTCHGGRMEQRLMKQTSTD